MNIREFSKHVYDKHPIVGLQAARSRFSFPRRTVSLLLMVLVATACTSGGNYQLNLMPAPDIYDDGNIDPFTDNDPISAGVQPDILYATDRAPAATGDKRYEHYTNQRGFVLRLGSAGIRFGGNDSITWEEARRVSLLKNRTEDYPLEVASVEEFGVLDRTIRPFDEEIEASAAPGRRFIAEIDRRLESSASQDVYIYVHGYKVDFENPLLVASEMWHFLGYNGAFIAFSWPTTAKRLAYFSDVETAVASARALRMLIVYIAEHSKAEQIHVVGYSAGTRVVGRMLADLGILGYERGEDEVRKYLKLGHVILTGSDVDRAILGGYLLDGALRIPASLTIYTSRTDKALGASRFMLGRDRSGQLADVGEVGSSSRQFFENTQALRIIDVTSAAGSQTGNGHAYFRSSPWVSSDILITLLYDLPPDERGLVWSDEMPLWTFPDDYVERLRDALRKSRPELFP
jgi:esterase/lipase superfamily enzyme